MHKTNLQHLLTTGALLTLIGTLTQLFNVKYSAYLFSIGALTIIIYHLAVTLDTKNADLRVQRLTRYGFISSLFLGLSSFFMFTNSNLWVLGVLIYALTSLFLSFRLK
jgi:hypothetical protein